MPQALDPQDENRFLALVRQNPANSLLIDHLPDLNAPDSYLVAGCLVQTVWNCLSGKSPGQHIMDYDVFYYDPTDLSWEAEDAVIRRARTLFGHLGVQVEVRNQARVHLWYEQKFGLKCLPLKGVRDGIDHFLNRSSCLGVRSRGGATEVYAPFGFADLFSMTVRPNCRRNLPDVYYGKARRWAEAWPDLQIVPWSARDQ
jgi:hypothetical protein